MIDKQVKHGRRGPHEDAFIETALTPGEVAEAVALEQKGTSITDDECAFLLSEGTVTEVRFVNQHQGMKP